MTNSPALIRDLVKAYKYLENEGLAHSDYILDQLPSPTLTIEGKTVISFNSNNYLGLSGNARSLAKAHEALDKFGYGTCESRKLGGNLFLLEELEEELADFKGEEAAMIFATGLMVNVGVIPAIVDIHYYMNLFFGREKSNAASVIFTDKLNHRSIQMGLRLSRADIEKYPHNDMEALSILMERHRGKNILMVTDGVFSMDGDLADLPGITKLAKEYDATVMVDDAHATAIWGPNGRGSADHYGLENEVHIKMGTLSKAFGALGGFIAGNKDVIKMLKSNTDTYYFTSSLPAEQAAALIETTKIIKESGYELRQKLWQNTYKALKGMADIGIEIPKQWSQIIPIIIGDEKLCIKMEQMLLDKGLLCSTAMSPAVAPGAARLRITINAHHTFEQIDRLLEALNEVYTELNIERNPLSQNDWQGIVNMIPSYMKEMLLVELKDYPINQL